jgi:hypothetical protein
MVVLLLVWERRRGGGEQSVVVVVFGAEDEQLEASVAGLSPSEHGAGHLSWVRVNMMCIVRVVVVVGSC